MMKSVKFKKKTAPIFTRLKDRVDKVKELFETYDWDFFSEDPHSGRITFEREGLKVNIYVTKMSVMVENKGSFKWYKNQKYNQLEDVLACPEDFI